MMDKNVVYPQVIDQKIYMAAGLGIGINELLDAIGEKLFGRRKEYELLIPYDAGAQFHMLRTQAEVLQCEYREDGIFVRVIADDRVMGRLHALS